MSLRIVKVVREVVHPASPTPPQVLVLSDADQRGVIHRSPPIVLFYKPKAEARLLSPDALKTSLSQTLTLFFPLAGRLKLREGRPAPEVDVDCNDAGTLLEEAQAEGSLEELGGFCLPLELWKLLLPSYLSEPPPRLEDAPLLGVRVTRFQCGGATIVFAMHHGLADASSAAAFITTWSAIALGKVVAVPPVHNRSLLAPRQPPRVTCAHPELTLVHPAQRELSKPGAPASSMMLDLEIGHLAALKQRATAAGAARSSTSFEALMGLLWRAITRAKGLDPAARVRLGTAVDVRRRLVPPLPPGYFGNAVFQCLAETTAGELLEGALSAAAERVRGAVSAVTDEHVRSALDFYALQDSALSVHGTCVPPTDADVVVTSWKDLPFYEAHFGMGRPDFVAPPLTFGIVSAVIILLPGHRKEGGVNAYILLRHDVLEKLRADPELQNFPELQY